MTDCRYVVAYPALERHRGEIRAAARARRTRLAFAVPCLALLAFAAFSVSAPFGLFVAAVGAGIVFFLALPGGSSVPSGDLAGVEGEVAVLERLKTLPDEFTLFNRLRLPDSLLPNGWRELDFVVVGPGGVWIVEVKNTPGHVYVQPEARHWPLAKRAGCGSRPSWNALDNPVQQVGAQVDALRRWLLQHGVAARPSGIVCLSHPEVAVENAEASPVPVLVRDQVAAQIRSDAAGAVPERVVESLASIRSPSAAKDRAA